MEQRTYLSTRQVGEMLGMSPASLTNWRSAGKGPPYARIGKKVVYPAATLMEWIERHTYTPELV